VSYVLQHTPAGTPCAPKRSIRVTSVLISASSLVLLFAAFPSEARAAALQPLEISLQPNYLLPNLQASPPGTQPMVETPIAANPAIHGWLLTGASDFSGSACPSGASFFASSNYGLTWNNTCMSLLPGKLGFGGPAVAYGSGPINANVAYIASIQADYTLTNGEIVVETSSNNGASWSTPPAIAVSSPGLTDRPSMVIDQGLGSPFQGAIYISVTQLDVVANTTRISVTHSSDGGTTWTTSFPSSTQTLPTVDAQSELAIGADGTVHLTWLHCVTGPPVGTCAGQTATIMHAKSTDGGTTWSAPNSVATVALVPAGYCPVFLHGFFGCLPNSHAPMAGLPSIDVDRSAGPCANTVYVATYNWTGTFMQVVVFRSTDGGATWGPAVPVAPPAATHDQFNPWISVGDDGNPAVSWLDRRNDPNNFLYREFATLSLTCGANFGPNLGLGTAVSNPNKGATSLGSFIGDYTGNVWVGHCLFASWTDTRTGVAVDMIGGAAPLGQPPC
jgi:hypothetical protein